MKQIVKQLRETSERLRACLEEIQQWQPPYSIAQVHGLLQPIAEAESSLSKVLDQARDTWLRAELYEMTQEVGERSPSNLIELKRYVYTLEGYLANKQIPEGEIARTIAELGDRLTKVVDSLERMLDRLRKEAGQQTTTQGKVSPASLDELPSDWSPLFDRIRRGTYTPQDAAAVVEGLRRGILFIATGERSLAVGGSVEDTVIVTGDNNVVYVFRGAEVGTLRKALPRATDSAPFLPNPFTDILAVRDPARFVGRKKVLGRLLRNLESGSIALVGERKVGKSSLLWQMKVRLEQEPGRIALFWDFSEPIPAGRLLYETVSRLGGEGDDWEAFRKRVHNRRVVLLLDELDLALERGFDLDMLRGCRARTQEETGFRVVTASRTRPRDIFKSEVGSWPYDFLIPTTLDPFTE
ncbi:MAG: hypothetical protein QXI12_05400, partial [Candidatus Methanomethyliaceae archaeon]